ncbi:hypothetical protein TRICI_005840 [Trichomonascus ciferrii]|uniref:D-arabinitol 2-dehydrogenase [ribulose-forming] n=1 Tax=Trichomonascus ciferrii TaxID=44093 RepID=A0A642UTI7_9ASCO|nr:hypothetical protein TRICI_005840 [Trichomonascus ciferrii]
MAFTIPPVAAPAKQLFSLVGKTAVITGGSGDMGFTVSKYLLQAGASLALIDNNLPKLEPAASSLSEWYKTYRQENNEPEDSKQIISSWACDISDVAQVKSTMEAIRKHHAKPLDVLINTAGYCENVTALDYSPLNLKRIVDVNLNGSMFVATEFARTLIADNHPGSVILVASMSGSIVNHPQPQTPYNMTKAGVIHMAKSLSAEWAKHNIRVNSLSPGYIMGPLTKKVMEADADLGNTWMSRVPMDRMADPSEFAGPIIFMASDASSYMNGHDLVVDGGYSVW